MLKKFNIILSIVTLVIVIISIVVVFLLIPAKKQPLIDYVAEYNKISKPVDFDPNDNATPYFDKAFELLKNEPNDLNNLYKLWPSDMNEDQIQKAKQCIEFNRLTITYLKDGISKKYYWQPISAENNEIIKSNPNYFPQIRRAIYLLILNSKFMAQKGQTESALNQLADIYKMGTFIAGPRLLVEQLVGNAISALSVQASFQIIDYTNPSTVILENFQKQITTLSNRQPFLISYDSERLMLDDEVQRNYLGYSNKNLFKDPNIILWKTLQILRGYPWAAKEHQKSVMMYDLLTASVYKTPWQLYSEGNDVYNKAKEIAKDTYLLNLMVPNCERLSNISYRMQVHTDGLLTSIAVLRYKADKGSYPKDLQELVTAGYLTEVPIDPFSGSPLVYKLTDNNFILYSFAENLKDDGGIHNSKWGSDGKGGDYVFWPVQHSEKGK